MKLDLLYRLLAAVAMLLLVALCAFAFASPAEAWAWLGTATLGMAFLLKDKKLRVTKALPNGAASVTTDGFDLGHGTKGEVVSPFELLISAPALTTGEQPDAKTIKYTIEHDTDAAFGTVATLLPDVLTQTGAGAAGAAAATKRVRLPSDTKRHVRVKATGSAIGDASPKSVTVELVF